MGTRIPSTIPITTTTTTTTVVTTLPSNPSSNVILRLSTNTPSPDQKMMEEDNNEQNKQRVKWVEGTVDNEFMNKKSSKSMYCNFWNKKEREIQKYVYIYPCLPTQHHFSAPMVYFFLSYLRYVEYPNSDLRLRILSFSFISPLFFL